MWYTVETSHICSGIIPEILLPYCQSRISISGKVLSALRRWIIPYFLLLYRLFLYPVSFLRMHPNVEFIIDEQAASELDEEILNYYK